ncbi:glycosyltransferase [Actinoalloteichus caeruleus]|uniref:glycosyltransferase n=1 Tax=Actinoalloteichus cyanogriseus TaxID=2893586 RepID=UPI0004AA576D|nr:nucleotide disphospho-sugar-binding domain-containing protein [Actinoalloteichus caeruleus]
MGDYLLCSSPIHGHVNPLRGLGAGLVRAGHRVRMLTGARFADAVAAVGIEHVPLPEACDYDYRRFDEVFPGRVPLTGIRKLAFDYAEVFAASMPGQYRALRAELDRDPAEALLVEQSFLGVLPLLAGPPARRPPVVGAGVFPLAQSSRDTAPFGMALPPLRSPLNAPRNAVLTWAAREVVFRAAQDRVNRGLRELGLPRLPEFVLDWPVLADRFTQLTSAGFEYPRSDLPASFRFVGPLPPSGPTAWTPPPWWSELDDARPVVHVTQGTIDNVDLDRLVGPTVRGLAGKDVLVVVATGGRPESAVPGAGALPPNVRVERFLAYDRLLPRVDVLVTNGGAGGTHQALGAGVPLVVAGDSADNPENAARVAWSGAGIDLRTGTPPAEAVADAVERVLREPRYRARAREFAAEIAGCDAPASVAAELAQVISDTSR